MAVRLSASDASDVRRAYLFPVPAKPLRSLLDSKARAGEEFREDEAALDVMLALDRDDLRPLRYLAARWGWSKNRVHRGLDDLRATAAEWRSFYADAEPAPGQPVGQAGTGVGQAGTKTGQPDTGKADPGTQVGQAGTDPGQYRPDPDLTTQKINTPPTPQGGSGEGGGADRFDDWWSAYPKKRAKKACRAKWKARRLDAMADDLIADVERRKAHDDRWRRGYAPDPSTYLNQDRWEDELTEPTRTAPAADDARNRPIETFHRNLGAARAALGLES